MIIAVALGLAIGLALGGLGGGGSILAVPVLAHLAGQPAAAATATSLVAVGSASAVGTVGHARVGNVRWAAAAAFVATGLPGSWAGASLNDRLDGDLLLLAFSGLVLVAAHRMLATRPRTAATADARTMCEPDDRPADRRGELLRLLAAGTIVGFLTGLFGVGGGFVIVPALTLALDLSMPVAVGTSLAAIVGNAAVALGFRGLGVVEWELALPFTATMLLGTLAGSLVAPRLPERRSREAFAGLLVAVAVGNGGMAIAALV